MVWIGDSIVMVSEAGIRSAMPTFLYVYVGDPDAVYERALGGAACRLAHRHGKRHRGNLIQIVMLDRYGG